MLEFWDSVASEYVHENDKVGKTHDQRFVEAMKILKLKDGMRMLNIWSRDCGLVPFIRKKKKDIELVNYELSPRMVEYARKQYPDENIMQGSLLDLPFPDHSFDAIVSLETLEHVSEPLSFLHELSRVAKHDSQLVMSVPPATVEYITWIDDLFHILHGEGPHRNVQPGSVKKMLKMAGFELKLHYGTLFIYIGPTQLNRYVPQFMHKLFGIRQFYSARARKLYSPGNVGSLCCYCGTCFGSEKSICPGIKVDFHALNQQVFGTQPEDSMLGNYKSIYIGNSREGKVVKKAASGGIVSQVLIDLLDKGEIDYAVHAGFDEKRPWLTEPKVSYTKEQVLKNAQSKYTRTAINSMLDRIRSMEGSCALVALPCHVHGLRAMQEKHPELKEKIRLIIGLYCGNVLDYSFLDDILPRFGLKRTDISELHYREGPWPGNFYVKAKQGKEYRLPKFHWNYLIPSYIQERCLYCTDLTNELADISVGDGWSKERLEENKGTSIVIARDDESDKILRKANLDLEKISAKEAKAMHSHGFDIKKRGSVQRIRFREKSGKRVPLYCQEAKEKADMDTSMKEWLIYRYLMLARTRFARKLMRLVPLSVLGKTIDRVRIIYKKTTR